MSNLTLLPDVRSIDGIQVRDDQSSEIQKVDEIVEQMGISSTRKRNYTGQHFWARGYYVSTVGRDEAVIRDYIRNQEKEDLRLEQLEMFGRD